jgi:hypothetical protein
MKKDLIEQKKAVANIRKELDENNLKDGDYCIILYNIFGEETITNFVYRNFADFERRHLKDSETIMYGDCLYDWKKYDI